MSSSRLDEVSRLITLELEGMAERADPNSIRRKRKAISALFPLAILLARRRQGSMLDAFSRVARASDSGEFMWHHTKPFIVTLFDMPNPPPLNWVLGLISPGVLWHDRPHHDSVATWGVVTPLSTEVDRSVVDMLLRIAFVASLRPHIPPELSGRSKGTEGHIVRQVRAIGDIEILRSYLLLVWSEWDCIDDQSEGLAEMQISI